MAIYGHAQNPLDQLMDFDIESVSIDENLSKLSNQCNVNFAYSGDFFNKKNRKSHVYNATLNQIIGKIIADTGIEFRYSNGSILFYKPKKKDRIISGFIEDFDSGEKLLGATIYSKNYESGTTSNEYGFFSISVPNDATEIDVTFVGYESKRIDVGYKSKDRITIKLKPGLYFPEAVVNAKIKNNDISEHQRTNQNQIKKLTKRLPTLGGEQDPIRSTHYISGVNSGTDGLGGIHVRGGTPGQVLTLMDGVPVYIPYHLLGIYSVYNASTLRSINLYKGSFPAKYGGRLSSILDVRTREGNKNRIQAEAAINLTNGQLQIEGPINKGKGSYLLAGRYMHSGFLLNSIFDRIYFRNEDGVVESNFYDFNIKFNYEISRNDRIYLSVFRGDDYMTGFSDVEEEDFVTNSALEINWGNFITSVRWNHLFSDKLFSNATLTFTTYGHNFTTFVEELNEDEDSFSFSENRSENSDFGIKYDFDYSINNSSKLLFGAGTSFRTFQPELSTFTEDDLEEDEEAELTSLQQLIESEQSMAVESYVYGDLKILLSPRIELNLGLRLSSFNGSDNHHLNLEPRFHLAYTWNKLNQISISASRMVQYMHLVRNSILILPNDIWLPTSNTLSPEHAYQLEFNYTARPLYGLKFILSTYIKKFNNLYIFSPDFTYTNLVEESNFSESLISGEGKSKGIELSLIGEYAKTNFNISYTLSKTDRLFETVNLNQYYPYNFDQRHQLKLFLNYNFNEYLSASLGWLYSSPAPDQMLEVFSLTDRSNAIDINAARGLKNSVRTNTYQRFDLSLNYHFTKGILEHTFNAGIYNVLNHKNIIYYELNPNSNNPTPIHSIPILPSLSYTLRY